MARGRPRKHKDADALVAAIEKYKLYLEETGRPPTMAGLAYYTGMDRRTLYNYSQNDEYIPALKEFRDWIVMRFEEIAAEKGNAGIIFLMKNYGYTDKTEHAGAISIEMVNTWHVGQVKE